jgi:peptidoglycan-associated lipoprotein
MRFVRNLIPLSVILALGVGVACKKPAPAPPAPAPAAEVAAPAPDTDAQKRADEEAAKRKAEADAEAARKAAAEAAEMAKVAKFKSDAEAALKDINFDFDKSDIREVDKAKLQAIADFLKANPDAKIQIAGNCDERGTVEYNLALGERRAHAAQNYLVGLGVDEGRLASISYGKEKPKVDGHDEASWLINRNCQFTLQ